VRGVVSGDECDKLALFVVHENVCRIVAESWRHLDDGERPRETRELSSVPTPRRVSQEESAATGGVHTRPPQNDLSARRALCLVRPTPVCTLAVAAAVSHTAARSARLHRTQRAAGATADSGRSAAADCLHIFGWHSDGARAARGLGIGDEDLVPSSDWVKCATRE
jgi:hypothetical protein